MLAPLCVADLMRTRFEKVPAAMSIQEFVGGALLRSSQLPWQDVAVPGRGLRNMLIGSFTGFSSGYD
jgi:hypothetical protein